MTDEYVITAQYVAGPGRVMAGVLDNPEGVLVKKQKYKVRAEDVYAWWARIELEDFPGMKFHTKFFLWRKDKKPPVKKRAKPVVAQDL